MQRILKVFDLGRMPYEAALAIQTQAHSERVKGIIPDTLFLLEHSSVYTLGRNADEANILADRQALAGQGIEVHKTGRGGDITYHGPGQLVGYPIISLREASMGVHDFVAAIEEALIRCLLPFGISGGRDQRNRGIWIGNAKIAAIGLKISRHVSMHGFALNVSTDLSFYENIIPCGIKGAGVTSMNALGAAPVMQDVKTVFIKEFAGLMKYEKTELSNQ